MVARKQSATGMENVVVYLDTFDSNIFTRCYCEQYVAATGESIIGTVVGRLAEYYRVDIGAAQPAILPVLAFEGATKKNKPNLVIGTLVYARVTLANKDMEPELQCVNPTTAKSDGYGELKGGLVIKCSLGLCRR